MPIETNENIIYEASNDLLYLQRDDEVLIIDSNTGMWLRSNKSGADLLKLCDGKKSVYEIIQRVHNKESIPVEAIKDSILKFINSAKDAKIIWKSNEPLEFTKYRSLNKVVFNISWKCNLKCIHCYARCRSTKLEMSASTIKNFIKDFSNKGVSQIVISGGEPLLREDLFDMIPICDSEIILVTNGTLIDSNTAPQIVEKFDKVWVSIEGPDENTNSYLRGKNRFEQAIHGLRLLRDMNKDSLLICSTVTTLNMEKAEQMLDLAQFLNRPISFGRFIPTNEKTKYLQPSGEEYSSVLQKIYHKYIELYKQCFAKRKYMPALYFDASATKQDERMIFHEIPVINCGAAETEISISPCGDIYPCPYLHRKEFVLGNIMEKPIDDIIAGGRNFSNKLNVSDFDACTKCYLRHICGGGCRAVALNNTHSLNGNDTYCSAYKLGIEGALWGDKSNIIIKKETRNNCNEDNY